MRALFFAGFLLSSAVSLSVNAEDYTFKGDVPQNAAEIHRCYEIENLGVTAMQADLAAADKRNQLDAPGYMHDLNEYAGLRAALDDLIGIRRHVDNINNSDPTKDAGLVSQKALMQNLDAIMPKPAAKELREKIPQFTDELNHMIWVTKTKNPNCPALLKRARERDAQPAPPAAKSAQ